LTVRSDFGRSVFKLNGRPGKFRRSQWPRRRWAALIASALALLGAVPSSLLAEDDDTATLRVTYDGRGPDDFYLDPGLVEGIAGDPAWTILVNTNNGLLAFAREGGIAGTALEPDLAAKLPDVSANGRVYSFKVRSGVRFSDSEDRTVQPTDVKWSIERALYLESPGRRYLLNIAGASEAKPSNPKGIRGIRVNDADRSVQITLNRPDPGFLKVLAMPWTFVVPEGTPYNDKSGTSSAGMNVTASCSSPRTRIGRRPQSVTRVSPRSASTVSRCPLVSILGTRSSGSEAVNRTSR
jgi:ABC-type transport system substrate-binding protein